MTIHYSDDRIALHHGHALDVAKTLDSASVQTIVTSPPYFGLRDYGEDGQIGAEETVDDYILSLVALFSEMRRVLAQDGTVWLNLGDSYSGRSDAAAASTFRRDKAVAMAGRKNTSVGIGTKQLLGVPWRVALALQADGWILRSEIIWSKPNPMPESVTDRPTKSHEHIFLLAKSPQYFYDSDAVREEYLTADRKGDRKSYSAGSASNYSMEGGHEVGRSAGLPLNELGKNKRTVWTVPTSPFAAAHFAVYPPELIRPCILAGSRRGDTVLDPFSGSGTTGMVATQEGRRYVGIDLNAEYLDLSLRTRFAQPVLDMTGGAA